MRFSFDSVESVHCPLQCGWISGVSLTSHSSLALWLRLINIPLAHPVLRPLYSDWIIPPSHKSPACRQQMVDLFSLYNHLSQLLIINLSITYLYIYLSIISFSLSSLKILFLWRTGTIYFSIDMLYLLT